MKIKINYLTCILISLLIGFSSCSDTKEDYLNNETLRIDYNYQNNKVSYDASITDSTLDIKLNIKNSSDLLFFDESLKINISDENLIADIITDRAIKLSQEYSSQTINELSSLILTMINSKFNSIPKIELNKMENQGLIMFYSLLKTTKRRIIYDLNKTKSNSPFLSTVSQDFKTENSSFIFNEDIGINVHNLISFIETKQFSLSEAENQIALYVLGCFDEEIITLQNLIDKVELLDIEDASRTKGWWGNNGSDWGCCGNYEGRCRFRHVFCLIHDMRCTNCAYWHCGPRCVEDERIETIQPIELNEDDIYKKKNDVISNIFIL